MSFQNDIPIVALEGMPNSGKTSTFFKIKKTFKGQVLTFNELYFSKKQLDGLADKRGTLIESKWFLEQEIIRCEKMKRTYQDTNKFILADRSYISTLAYCYARAAVNQKPQEYDSLLNFFKEQTSQMPQYKLIIVFENNVNASISRRSDCDSADSAYWHDISFMRSYREFYDRELETFQLPKIVRINTCQTTLDSTYNNVIDVLLRNNFLVR